MNQYPKEVSPLITTKNTLSATLNFSALTKQNIADGHKPLDIHSPFSRVTFTIIDYSNPENKKTVSANIPAKRRLKNLVKSVQAAIEICRQKKWTLVSTTEESCEKNPAYTVRITSGKLKGKTPAEVMLKNPEQREDLKNQYIWLKNNLEKYPKNKIQMDAIAEAINLYDAQALSEEEMKSTSLVGAEFVVYEDQIKIPHADKKDANGLTDIYSIKVTCCPDKNYPFSITIMNGMAPVTRSDKGTITANMQMAKNVVTNTFNASIDDFEAMMEEIYSRCVAFENMWYPAMSRAAEDIDKANREAAMQKTS